jgi:hypothetical protein
MRCTRPLVSFILHRWMGSQISLTLLFVFCRLVQQLRLKRPGHSAILPRTEMSHSTTTHPRCTRVQGFLFQRGKRGRRQRAGARGDTGSGQNTEMIGMDWVIDNPRSPEMFPMSCTRISGTRTTHLLFLFALVLGRKGLLFFSSSSFLLHMGFFLTVLLPLYSLLYPLFEL